MIKELRDIAIGFIILAVAYSASIYNILQVGLNLPDDFTLFKISSGAFAVCVFLYFFISVNRIPVRVFVNTSLVCIAIITLFYATRSYYLLPVRTYHRYFLNMGVRLIPALTMGAIMLQDSSVLQKMEKALLPFMLLFTIVLAKTIFSVSRDASVSSTFNDISSLLNYQLLSYYSMFAFGMTLYLICNRRNSRLFLIALTALAILQFVMALMAGGRGAFVMGIVFCLYFGWTRLSIGRLILYLFLIIVAFIVIQHLLANNEVFNLGFGRIMGFFGNQESIESDERWTRWYRSIMIFETSPIIGHGLGSIFYETGLIYSHDIFADILCEGGVILLGIFAFLMYRFGILLKDSIKYDHRNELLLVLFLCSFVYLCFSGYYLCESTGWLAVSYVLCRGRNYENELTQAG